jgi:hypothetical protein
MLIINGLQKQLWLSQFQVKKSLNILPQYCQKRRARLTEPDASGAVTRVSRDLVRAGY